MVCNLLPQFTSLNPSTFVDDLKLLLKNNLEKIAILLQQNHFDWNNLMHPLEDMEDAIERFWSPFSHQHAVINSELLRQCYQTCLPLLTAYEANIGQNHALYEAIRSIDKASLNATQQKIVTDTLRDFELSGVALLPTKKARFEQIQTRLAALANQFENNVLDATDAFSLLVTDEALLKGLPLHALQAARELAVEKGVEGWLLNLEFPCYIAVITYAENRTLRETFYEAYVTRASDQGPHAGQFDNTAVMDEILALRHEKAQLLGFANYAEFSLATKMAESPASVLTFLSDLVDRTYGQAESDINNLAQFALSKFNINPLKPWDIAFLSEKLRQSDYALSQEELRPYFTQKTVIAGLFTVIQRLYGVQFEKLDHVDVWHPDVICYRVLDEQETVRGFVYLDLFARAQKRGGAWMDSCQSRRRLGKIVQLPVATLTCNFAKPVKGKEATFSHEEVLTLFHEFGHCLHHLLTKVDYLSASGINGVEWDAVELPSQILENWCWEKSVLQLITSHAETEEKLPPDLYEKMLAAKNFQSAMSMLRQLEFALFDFRIHKEYMPGETNFVAAILSEVRQFTSVVPLSYYNRFQHSFSHIFAGGYAAGYYSYKWAEVLSSDAFARFEEEGILNAQTGRDFLHSILEVGSSKKAEEAFFAFRGREPQVEALLRHNGIIQ